MNDMVRLEVAKNDLSKARIYRAPRPALADGEILTRVEEFALTANNVTYGVVGGKIGYWKFFPAEDGWGVIPVWGVASVVESKADGIEPGERLYGYFPMGSHLVMKPDAIKKTRFIDGAPHRAGLPPVYNAYQRLTAQPDYDQSTDEARMLLFPLFATSFCLYDFLLDNGWFGATQIVIPSASSKTALGLEMALNDDDKSPASVGLTSASNVAWLQARRLYDTVLSYDELEAVDATKPTVIVDMSGNGAVLSALHRRLGDNMKYTSNVGVTHYSENAMGPDFIRERSHMFFAPGHMQKRAADWGPGEFEQRATAFWKRAAEASADWLKIERVKGADAAAAAFEKLRSGDVDPKIGLIVRC